MSKPQLCVGFDLDMTLVDSRRGIVSTLDTVLSAHGVRANPEDLWSYIGHPLPASLGRYLPEADIPAAVEAYRAEYLRSAVTVTTALPGAEESVRAVHDLGGRVVVVSAKVRAAVVVVLESVGLIADAVVGDVFGHDKGAALRAEGVQVYVGDHVGDVVGARAAGALAVAVLTGPNARDELERAGADLVLEDLSGFARWLRYRQTRQVQRATDGSLAPD